MTKVGAIIHSIGVAFHNIFSKGHSITVDDVKQYAEDITRVANIYQEISAETKDITDPAAKVDAICEGILKHQSELPDDLKGSNLESYIVEAAHSLSGLPLDQIESIVKSYLAAKQG